MVREALQAFKRRAREAGNVRFFILEESERHGAIKVEAKGASPREHAKIVNRILGAAAKVAKFHDLEHDYAPTQFVIRFRRKPEAKN